MEKKSKLLYLLKCLLEKSDEDNPVSTHELMAYLEEKGMTVHRTTIASDIALLNEAGFDIITVKSSPNKYFIGSRSFELPEIMLLMDAVLSAKFITPKKSRELIRKLSTLVSVSQGKTLQKHAKVAGRAKSGNEKIYYAINEINNAIFKGRKVSFTYFEYDANKKRVLKNNKQPYILSPYGMVWVNDKYYVIGYSEKHERIGQFRVDRIAKITTTEMPLFPAPPKFNLAGYVSKAFEMYDGEEQTVELLCMNKHMKSVIDKFGDKVQTQIHDDEHFIATVNVCISPTFFAWVFKFCGEIKIHKDEQVKNEYRKILSLSQI